MARKARTARTPEGAQRRGRGFERTSSLLADRIGAAAKTRGFALGRLLTRWDEIVGPDIAAIARPAEVRYARRGVGATLTVLTSGARAPLVEMQKERIRAKVNAVYGYAAIARVRLTQTAQAGFAEEQAGYAPPPRGPAPGTEARATALSETVADPGLRAALESLGRHVLSRNDRQEREE